MSSNDAERSSREKESYENVMMKLHDNGGGSEKQQEEEMMKL